MKNDNIMENANWFMAEPKKNYADKTAFINWMKNKTFDLHIRVIRYCELLEGAIPTKVINYQIIKSASSVTANYRAACRARSRNEFYAKMCIVVEEADETEMWLMTFLELGYPNSQEIASLLTAYREVLAICTKAKDSLHRKA